MYHLVCRQLHNTVPVTGTETRRVIYAHTPRTDLWTFLHLITARHQSNFRALKLSLLRLDRHSAPVISAECSFSVRLRRDRCKVASQGREKNEENKKKLLKKLQIERNQGLLCSSCFFSSCFKNSE